jgi:hypothetical protein
LNSGSIQSSENTGERRELNTGKKDRGNG